jgi:hypothetical protein
MVRDAERTPRISLPSVSWPATECTIVTSSASAGDRAAGSRAGARQHRLAGARRTDHQD